MKLFFVLYLFSLRKFPTTSISYPVVLILFVVFLIEFLDWTLSTRPVYFRSRARGDALSFLSNLIFIILIAETRNFLHEFLIRFVMQYANLFSFTFVTKDNQLFANRTFVVEFCIIHVSPERFLHK